MGLLFVSVTLVRDNAPMAVKRLIMTCDYCNDVDDDYESLDEAREFGWFVVNGPERSLGGDGERVYCSLDCLKADL